jgi:hypothetical protein
MCSSWLFFVLVLVSLTISIVTATSCKFLILTEGSYGLQFGVGLFRIQDVENQLVCVAYSDEFKEELFDVYIELGRFFVVVNATLTGVAAILWLLWHFLYPKTRRLWKAIRALLYLLLWACGLTFCMSGFEKCDETFSANCVVGIGGIAAIVNILV